MAKTSFTSGGKGGAMRGQSPAMSGPGKNNTPKANTFRPLPNRNSK